MKVLFGCDPNAMDMKNDLMKVAEKLGCEVVDMGSEDPIYANTAIAVAEAVAAGKGDRGVLVCGTGIGMSVAANKVKGAYAALLTDVYSAQRSVLSNNANIACMGAFTIGSKLAEELLKTFLSLRLIRTVRPRQRWPAITHTMRHAEMKKQSKLYLGTNTKMYKTIAQTVEFLSGLRDRTADISREELELFVIPSFTTLERARQTVTPEQIHLGAQNMGWEQEGQFSGEISPVMLKEVGMELVMIGHSERRHVLGETDEMENKKVLCALKNGLTPLLCIGETGEQKALGLSDEVLRTQIKIGLHGVRAEDAAKVWIAYEPVWAIGVNGVPATKEYAEEKHGVMRATLNELYGEEVGSRIPLLYGGSVNPENAPGLIQRENIDGLFIGRSAWQADKFESIIRTVLPLWRKK